MTSMSRAEGTRAVLGVGAAVIALVALVIDIAANIGDHGLSSVDLAIWVSFGLMTAMGLLVCLARPSNRVGWMMLLGGALSTVGGAAIDVAHRHVVHGAYAPMPSVLILSGSVARTYGWVTMTLLVATYFPEGRTLPGRWRHLPRLAVVAMSLIVINTMFDEHANLTDLPQWHNPLSTPFLSQATGPLSPLGILGYAVLLGFAVAQLVIRFRRGDAIIRQQIGILAAVAFLPVFAMVLGVLQITGSLMFGLAVLPLPIAIGFAVLARGLYDLATAANRTLVWLLLSGVIVTIYALVIVGVGGLLDVQSARWLPWAAGAAIALSFAPLRDALQRAANRVTFGRWEDPRAVLATLGQHLEVSADADRLLRHAVTELHDTLRLENVCVVDSAGQVVAGAAHDAGPTSVPATAYGDEQGRLYYTTQTALRPADLELVNDLATHIGAVLHARGLTADLQKTRERLVIAREEERRRLRRDLHDGLGPALAGHLLRVDLVRQRLGPDEPAREELETLRGDLQNTVLDVRRVVEGLRPPALDDMGLAAAVASTASKLTAATDIDCELDIGALPRLAAAVEVAAYRIATEAITNVVKHSTAKKCRVTLAIDGSCLVVEIADDGSGGMGSGIGHGQDTMRERAEELGGSFAVTESDGVRVTARLPLGVKEAR